jgi:hypothetical protein
MLKTPKSSQKQLIPKTSTGPFVLVGKNREMADFKKIMFLILSRFLPSRKPIFTPIYRKLY